MLVEQGVEVGRQDGVVGQEWTGHHGATTGETQAGAAEARTGRTWSSLTRRELGRRGAGREGRHRRIQERFALLLATLVPGENGIHTKLQQWLVA